MSKPQSVLFNTDEEILSSDFNRLEQLSGKELMEALRNLVAGVGDASLPRTVTQRGLSATAGSGLSVNISPGTVMQFQTGPFTDESQYRLGRLDLSTNVVLAASNPTNSRIDLIVGTIASVDTDGTPRSILTPPARTVSPVVVNKTRKPALTLSVITGTPAAVPTFPTAPAGTTAIWFVFVSALATTLSDDRLMDARAYFFPASQINHHGIDSGLSVGPDFSNPANIQILSGNGSMRGAPFSLVQLSLNGSIYLQPNVATYAPGEYHVYAIAVGAAEPIGKSTANGVALVISPTPPNTSTARPSTTIAYNATDGGSAVAQRLTTNALYLGTVRNTASGITPAWEAIGSGTLFGNGTLLTPVLDATTGKFAANTGWVKKPKMLWVNGGQIDVRAPRFVLNGVPGQFSTTALSLSNASLAQGETWLNLTFYYVYVRTLVPQANKYGAVRSYALVASSEPPTTFGTKPTPEGSPAFASNDYLYVGSFYNVSAGSMAARAFIRVGNITMWLERLQLYDADPGSSVRAAIAMAVPATTPFGIVNFQYRLTTGFADVDTSIYNGVGTSQPRIVLTSLQSSTDLISATIEIIVSGPTFEVIRTAIAVSGEAYTLLAEQVGYVEDIEELA